jgi:hypothetical protein
MSYPEIGDDKFNDKLLNRKEFYTFKPDKSGLQKIPGSINDGNNKGLLAKVITTLEEKIIPREEMEEGLIENDFLNSHSYQHFVSNFQNPNTNFTRLLVKWDPGLGKTIGALNIAMNFLEYYRRETEMGIEEVGSIFILGFSYHVFKTDLLKYPAFGFISHEELKRYEQLRKFAESGASFDIERLHEFITRIKKRFSNRKRNGFFKFFGYKEFVNRILVFSSNAKKRKSLNTMSEVEILAALKSGEMKFNPELIDSFKNSLIICDEIHNVYNSSEKNNWGIVIQAILNSQPSVRAVFLSATPIINNPSECIDVANLLLSESERLNKRDFFNNNEELLPGALEKLAKIFQGRVSYTRNQNPKLFPEKIIVGESIPDIPYLKFIRCPMSDYHYDTYKKVFNGSISQDSQYLNDFCLPNPDFERDKIGLFSTELVRQTIRKSTQRWRDQNKIDFIDEMLVGEFMQLPGLQKYSNKYATAMNDIRFMLQHGLLGKALIYHNSVQMSGVLFIQEMLKQNGFIDETSNPNDSTLCQICGYEKREHKAYVKSSISAKSADTENHIDSDDDLIANDSDSENEEGPFGGYFKNAIEGGDSSFKEETNKIVPNVEATRLKKIMDEKFKDPHEFVPARFAMAHSRIDNNQVRKSIDSFNSPQNTEGRRCCIMVGARKIKESYDFKAIRNLLVLGKPDNIPTLIQIIGRAIRSGSHLLLPPDQRKVYVRLYTSAVPEKILVNDHTQKHSIYKLSYEEEKYRDKVKSYITIQKIERVMHENAIDSITNRNIIFSDEEVSNKDKLKSNLGTLWFEPNATDKNLSLDQLNTDTFDVYYAKNEINTIIMIIKRLFIESQPVWCYKELLDAVRNPPMSWDMPYNTKLFSEQNFQIALNKLIWSNKKDYFIEQNSSKSKAKNAELEYIEPIIETEYTELEPFNRLMNPDDKLITLMNGQRSIICQYGNFYILFPMEENNKPSIDIEMPYRNITNEQHITIDIMQYLEDRPALQDYSVKKYRFKTKYLGRSIEEMQAAICDYGSDFHQMLLEECILYAFNIWTTGVEPKLSENSGESLHDFYFKMISYYDLIGLIIWAAGAKKNVLDKYRTYITKPIKLYRIDLKKEKSLNSGDVKNLNKMGIIVDNDPISSGSDTTDSENELNKSDIVRILKSTIRKSRCDWLPNDQKRRFYKSLSATIELSHDSAKEFSKQGVPANILPIGHFMKKIPRFYHPESGWYEVPDYVSSIQMRWKENPIIIGYDEKSRTGVHVRFKIRNPIQNVKQYKDTRKIEKGSVCSSKSKEYLFDIARQLKIDIPSKLNVGTLCDIIRARLIRNEIEERKKIDSNVKWFYHYFDNTRPETMIDNED